MRITSFLIFATVISGASASFAEEGEWRHYGSDQGGQRYSPLEGLSPDNVDGLERAWVFRTGGDPATAMTVLQATPIMVGDSLYLCTAQNEVIALDPETGDEQWRYTADVPEGRTRQCRGVTYFKVPNGSGTCAERIFTATADARLIALDAHTGEPCPGFGQDGAIDLSMGMGEVPPHYYYVTSAPTIVRGNIVVGGWVADNQYVGEPPGVIRGFDAVTGDFAWAFDPGDPDDHDQPLPGETYELGTPNSWAPMSGDEELGLVYVPTGNATPDYWGAHRTPESEEYTSSVVAIDAETGAARWHFRTVHHDVWDYDVPSQPTLIDLEINGETVPALIQPTKRGQTFLLDRRTGAPLAEVEERPVPQDPAPGDWLSPTQPFSVGMPDFAGPDLEESDMWGLTPFDQLWCRIKFKAARYDGPMTPPGTRPSITHPGYLGGTDWGGVAVDPKNQLMVGNWSRVANYTQLIPRKEADAMGVAPSPIGYAIDLPNAQAGTPYAATTEGFLSPLGVPCTSPPYAIMTAVDLKTRKVIWSRPFGRTDENGPLGIKTGLPLPMGVPAHGGSIITASGLIFVAASVDQRLRAFDAKTGEILWTDKLPAAGHATPMTYLSRKSGRQFVVVSAGGHAAMQSTPGDYVVAYTLPAQP